jgi:4-diphosphocytidyl-2-C-methyl-D-erythritol kinase
VVDDVRAPIRVAAPAKVNLYLHVVGRRPDGFHELDSLVAFAEIGDLVTAAPAPALSLTIDGPFAGALEGDPAENLILRAARLLAAHAGIVPRAALGLTKTLPVASGVGGGSSDAAAALHALTRLWQLRLAEADLAALAARLGADVPVCLARRTAWLGGIGEALAPAPALPPLAIVLANPGLALPTPAVFKARRGPFSASARFAWAADDGAAFLARLAHCRNDLTEAAIEIVPEVAAVLRALAASEGALLSRMSGSGATCFALYADLAAARAAAATIAARDQRWWTAAGMLLSLGR